jgi:secreted trypsin-like serine protease
MRGRQTPLAAHLAAALLIGAALTLTPRSAGAVVAGSPADASIGQSLVMVLTEGGGVCSGVVLAPQVVLTAGHCLQKGKAVRVYAPLPGAPAGAPRLIAPSASAVHPAYAANAVGTRRRSVDLALLRLPEALPPHFTAAQIAAAPAPGAGTPVVVAGDGLADEANPNSSGKPRSALLTVVEPYGRSTILLWAEPAPGAAAGACKGDSGGAMAMSSGALIAVIAFAEGAGGARCGKLTQGVLVAPQRSFIDATLAKWGAEARWADR